MTRLLKGSTPKHIYKKLLDAQPELFKDKLNCLNLWNKNFTDIDLIFNGGNFKTVIFLLCFVVRLPFSSLNFQLNCFIMSFYFVKVDVIMKIGGTKILHRY